MSTPAWKTQLKKASFRGISFGVVDIETVFGRRNVLHEYPLRDDPFAEDLGRKAREFTINAFVIGDNYIQARDALIAAIENKSTPGILVHPTLGIRNVVPTQCRNIFKNTEGGIEYFSLTFVDAGQNQFPTASTNTQQNSNDVADSSNAAIQKSFSTMFNVVGLQDSAATRAAATMTGDNSNLSGIVIPKGAAFLDMMNSIIAPGVISSSQQTQYSTLKSNMNSLDNTASTLVTTPSAFASSVATIINGLNQIYSDNPNQALLALIQLFTQFGLNLPPTSNIGAPETVQEALNQQQLIDLIALTALIEMIRSISSMTFASRQDALAVKDKVVSLMEPKLLYLANNFYYDAYSALSAAKTAMVLDVVTRAGTLKNIIYVQNKAAIPALVFAYMQYGDATQVSDVISRNSVIRNPGFVPPLTNIEVLK